MILFVLERRFFVARIIPFRVPGKKPTKKDDHIPIGPLENIISNFGLDVSAVIKIDAYLRSLRGYVSSNSIATAQALFVGQSLDDLEKIAENSNQNLWSNSPGYFRALVDEIVRRRKEEGTESELYSFNKKLCDHQ